MRNAFELNASEQLLTVSDEKIGSRDEVVSRGVAHVDEAAPGIDLPANYGVGIRSRHSENSVASDANRLRNGN